MNRIMTEIMDLRDARICLQHKVVELEEKALWEPNNFTEEDSYWLRYYRADIARIKDTEEEFRHCIQH